jgi:signal transduction histidine kinase
MHKRKKMNKTNQKEAAARKVYERFWESYTTGNLEAFSSTLDEAFEMIGTSESEVCHNKADGIAFYKAQVHEIVGKVEMRNRSIAIKPVNEMFLFNETCDIYILTYSEWAFYSKIRISTFLNETEAGWKVVQQHGSLPDMRVQEGETLAFEKITKENLDLREAIKRRTVELEHKNRELEIEAALERVRSTSLAMHNSHDLSKVVHVVFTELVKLDAQLDRCLLMTVNPETLGITWYLTGKEGLLSNNGFLVPDNTHPSHQAYLEGWRTKRKKWHYYLAGEEKQRWDAFGFAETELAELPDFIKADMAAVKAIHLTISSDDFGCLIASSLSPLSAVHAGIVERFTIVFNQTYTRFLDLQKAEAQAREAQIEAALERVRSSAMAMHKSDELLEAGEIIFVEMQKLGIESLTSGFVLMDKEEQNGLNYTPHPGTKKIMPVPVIIPHNETIHMQQVVENWKNSKPFFIIEMEEDETIKHQTFIAERSTNFPLTAAELIAISPARLVLHNFFFKEGYILIVGGKKLSVEQTEIMLRFAKVFQQTYTRFLDLQKAEAQAREAQIEASLERVRAHTMGMQSSNDLSNVASVMFNQMKNLGGELLSFAIVLCDKQKDMVEQWHNIGNEGMLPPFFVPVDLDYIHRYRYDQWKAGAELFSIEIPSNYIVRHFELMFELPSVHAAMADATAQGIQLEIPAWEIDYGASFSHGYLLISSFSPFKEDHIFPRFAKVFDQAYTRFLDLQKAEAQAREAQIEAALERVRSRTLAMHKSDELADAAFVLFQQLALLGVVHERINIGIVQEGDGTIDFWVTEQGGNQINTRFTGSKDEPTTISKLFAAWKGGQKSMLVDLTGIDLTQWLKYLEEIGIPFDPAFTHDRRVQTAAFFSKGMLVVTTPGLIPHEHVHLLERFAAVFNLTYTRFNDLQVAEAHARQAEQDLIAIKESKQKAEDALTELQATQKQLIQSEKMASLGELTAGIAHEIQNPLNFVNNFSEVSKELIDEVKSERSKVKGERDEILEEELLNDIAQNLEKISHHGKRADAIVKGMLQHSSSGSGKKESTDINALADEYLRLAYHGLKAKDNSFNAIMKTDFDKNIGSINIIPQDIGRVILNLITNAFYAVNEKGKQNKVGFEPIVAVSTRKVKDKVEVMVKDNGNGIPQKVLDKIFQPFFTTKPTGQGTGLGLSLSYDIVKAHNGKLKVETTEGEGSLFIIELPENT